MYVASLTSNLFLYCGNCTPFAQSQHKASDFEVFESIIKQQREVFELYFYDVLCNLTVGSLEPDYVFRFANWKLIFILQSALLCNDGPLVSRIVDFM